MAHLYILGCILFTVYGQIILKWRIVKYGAMPESTPDKISFFITLIFDPYIFSGLFAAFLASLCWMAAMTKFELSYAYPFIGSTYVLVLMASAFLFHETITPFKIAGTILIVLGISMMAK